MPLSLPSLPITYAFTATLFKGKQSEGNRALQTCFFRTAIELLLTALSVIINTGLCGFPWVSGHQARGLRWLW